MTTTHWIVAGLVILLLGFAGFGYILAAYNKVADAIKQRTEEM